MYCVLTIIIILPLLLFKLLEFLLLLRGKMRERYLKRTNLKTIPITDLILPVLIILVARLKIVIFKQSFGLDDFIEQTFLTDFTFS